MTAGAEGVTGKVTADVMDRLDFALKDWTRLQWVSQPARDLWEPRISRVSQALAHVEVESVRVGIRKCAWLFTDNPDNLMAQAEVEGMEFRPLEKHPITEDSYSSAGREWTPGEPYRARGVYGKPADVEAFSRTRQRPGFSP